MKKLLLHEQYDSDPQFSSTEKWSLVSLNKPDVRGMAYLYKVKAREGRGMHDSGWPY